jgi:hypothetical protein
MVFASFVCKLLPAHGTQAHKDLKLLTLCISSRRKNAAVYMVLG